MKNILFIICLFSFFSYAQIPSNIPEEGLIGYWPLDGDANDYSGNENHGAVYGATATSDRFGNPNSAYNFSVDGSGGWGAAQHRIVVSNPSIPNDNSFTMSAWVNLETKPSPFNNRPHTIMGRWDSNGARVFRYKIIYNGDVITQLFSGSSNYSHSSGNVSYGNWAHVVSTYDGTILKHYINGVLSGQETLSITINSSSTNLTFGEMHMSNGHWYLFSGKMDDLGYWSRALNSEEITSIFSSNPCQEASINASATEVCAGESVEFNINIIGNNFSNWASGEPNNLASGTEHFGLFLSTGRWNDGPDSYTLANCIVESETNLGVVNNFTYLGVFENHHYYLYDLTDGWNNCNNLAVSLGGYLAIINSQLETNFIFNNLPTSYDRGWIGMYQDTNNPEYSEPGGAWFWIDGTPVAMSSNLSTYAWSTGDTSETITVTPTETTDYWVDVTTDGTTCREYITIDITAPAAPTGDAEQTFCAASTVADLLATGDNIQWYDAATGGNLLDSTTALTDGQMVYASQTVNGCESTDRLEVTVSIQDITITASATEVCAGESVDLSVVGDVNSTYLWSTGESNFSGQGTLVDEYSLVANSVSQNTFSITPGNIYRLEVSGTISLGGGAGNQRDVAYYIQSGSDGTVEGTPFDSECNLRIWTSLFCENPGLRPSPDIYDPINHTYSYPFTSNSSSLEVGFWDSPLGDNGPNVVTFKLYELSNSESIITINPTETTEYWVDVTTNGVTCREYITINVTAPAAPTGNSVQGGCSDFTVGSNNNAFTGENLQWYANPSGGTALPDNHLLVDGTYYYISQTVDGCESIDRFEFQYLAPEPTITIVSPLICEGESATVSVTSSPFVGTATFLWNTGETSETITLSPTESTSYWVDQVYNSGSPENIQTVCRYFFGVAVDQAPDSPISGGDITECETIAAQNLVATVTANTGQTIIWYDALTSGGVVSDPSLNTAGTVTYYAETISDSSGCPSLSRTAVTLTITSIDSPTGDSVQSFCDVSTIADLTVTGDDIQWYDSATGGTLLDDTTVLIDGQLVYASQTLDGCESLDRLGVSVEIDIITDPILITTELNFCLAREATLADLEIDAQGFELEWYDSYTGGTLLGLDTILEDAISYYATLYDMVSGCESLMRLEVIPAVIPCEVIIYNAISLNDNGLNDYMVIENAEYFPFNTLEIFNRDGYLVYNQRKYGVGDNLFRGMANVGGIYSQGSNLPTGSYLYVFTYYNPYEQQEFVKKGFLTINNN